MTNLNCSDYASALSSTSKILSISEEKLTEILKLIPDTSDVSSYHHQCFDELLRYLNYETKEIAATWFHGTRIFSIDSFLENGLMPKAEGYKILMPLLEDLAKDVEYTSGGTSAFGLSKLGKSCLGKDDEGPFATLFKQRAESDNYHFTKCPEAVEDIAEGLAGNNFPLLTKKFIHITRPALIEFIGYADNDDLENSLYYLHQVIHGENEIETACRIDAFYKGEGKTIPSERIKAVHFLDKNETIPNLRFSQKDSNL